MQKNSAMTLLVQQLVTIGKNFMLKITQLKEKFKAFFIKGKKPKLVVYFTILGLLFLLLTTPLFYQLKKSFMIMAELFLSKHISDKDSWINILNSWFILAALFFLFSAFYIYSLENQKTKYLFPFFITFSFVVSNIWIMKVGFPGGYSNTWNFNDFLHSVQSYSKATYYGTNYPPLAVVFFKFLYMLFPKDSVADTEYVLKYLLTFYFIFTIISLFLLFQKSIYEDEKHKAFFVSTFFLTGPLLFAYQRMNIMHLALIFTMIFFLYYNSPSKPKQMFALFSLAIAANIKYFPAIFGLILVKEKKWKSAIICFLMGCILFLLPFFLQKSQLHASELSKNSVSQTETNNQREITTSRNYINDFLEKINSIIESTKYFTSNPGVLSSVSTEAIVYRVATRFGITSWQILHLLMKISLGLFFTTSIFAFFIAKDNHSSLLILSLIAILTPISNAWYGLIFLFIPFFELLKKNNFSVIEHIEFILYNFIFIFVMDYRFKFFMPNSSWHVVLLFFMVIFDIIKGGIIRKK